jgi:hypothetical protein
MTRLQVERSRILIPVGATDFYLVQNIQTSFGIHTSLIFKGYQGSLLGEGEIKQPGREVNIHLAPQ